MRSSLFWALLLKELAGIWQALTYPVNDGINK